MSVFFTSDSAFFDVRSYDEFAPPPGMTINEDGGTTCRPTDRIGIIWLLVNVGADGKEYDAQAIAGELDSHGPYGSVKLSKVQHRLSTLVSDGLLAERVREGYQRRTVYRLTELAKEKYAAHELLK